MSIGEILYWDLMGCVLIFAADVFHLWEPWANAINRLLDHIRARRMRR